MSDKKERAQFLDSWRDFKKEHPAIYTAAAVLPVTGQAAAVADYADAMDRGDSVDGAIAAASFIPGFKLGKMAGSKFAPPSLRLKSQMTATEKAIAPITKRAHQIGRAADAQQGAEAFINQANENAPGAGEVSLSDIKRAEVANPGREKIGDWDEFVTAFRED